MTIINYARPCHSHRNLQSISGSIRHAAVPDRSGTRHLRRPSHTTVILPFPAENHCPIADGLFSSLHEMHPAASPSHFPSPRTTLALLPLQLFHDMIKFESKLTHPPKRGNSYQVNFVRSSACASGQIYSRRPETLAGADSRLQSPIQQSTRAHAQSCAQAGSADRQPICTTLPGRVIQSKVAGPPAEVSKQTRTPSWNAQSSTLTK